MSKLTMAKGLHVKVHDEELLRRRQANKEYLAELTNENLLLPYTFEAGIYKTAGIPQKMHGGWESPLCELRGHFLGHYLSACAMHYEATGSEFIKGKADEIVDVLEECQRVNGKGWVGSIPEKYLDWIADGRDIWAPQYTLHKTLMGLIDMYEMAGNEKALRIADKFADWFVDWSAKYTHEEFQKILDVETGGMLEAWASLYRITGNEKYIVLRERYYRNSLFDGLLEGKDVTVNMHANTTVPEILGMAEWYKVTGDVKYLNICKAYWKSTVIDKGSFSTGSQTTAECWNPKDMSARLSQKNQEHCMVYNMMRLAEFLFSESGDAIYMDYWEKNLYNGIMAQAYWQKEMFYGTHNSEDANPDKALLIYFLPLTSGSKKRWSTRTDDFWCCHGTMVQANAAFNKSIYWRDENSLYIGQYIQSEYNDSIAGSKLSIRIVQDQMNGDNPGDWECVSCQKVSETNTVYQHHPDFDRYLIFIDTEADEEIGVKFRIPGWLKGKGRIFINGEPYSDDAEPSSFAEIRKNWKKDVVCLEFPRGITCEKLPGTDNMFAFLEGPVALAGLVDEERLLHLNGKKPENLLTLDNEREWSVWMKSYKTAGQERGIHFVPINSIGYETYTVYFPVEE